MLAVIRFNNKLTRSQVKSCNAFGRNATGGWSGQLEKKETE